MDRRTFLKSSSAATVGGLATTSAAMAAKDSANEAATTRTLALNIAPTLRDDETALVARRFMEATDEATNSSLTFNSTDDAAAAHVTIATVLDRRAQHPAWSTLHPLVNGLDGADFAGWLATGGGTTILEQLEAATQEKILIVGARPAPHGLWADRELFGLHPRPSLTVRATDHDVLSHNETGSGAISLLLSDGLVADLEADRLSHLILHALPTSLAGEPIALTMPMSIWSDLSKAEQTVLATLADASLARTVIETHVTAQMAKSATPLPAPIPLPAEFHVALATAVTEERQRLAQSSHLAADSLASQAAYRSVTAAKDLIPGHRPLAS